MKKIGIFYGSSSGNAQTVARTIAGKLSVDKSNVIDVAEASSDQLFDYDVLLLGTSTWKGGSLQDNWDDFIKELKKADLSGKEIAVFGTGDSYAYPEGFCNAIATVVEAAEQTGAKVVGKGVPVKGYTFLESTAVKNGLFCGLPLDPDNEGRKTEVRLSGWLDQVKKECGILS